MEISAELLGSVGTPESVMRWFNQVFSIATVDDQTVLDTARSGPNADYSVYVWFQDNLFLEGGVLYPPQVITVDGGM